MSTPAQLAGERALPHSVLPAMGSATQQHDISSEYITSFVRQCFAEDLCEVDFNQATTAMDYLKIFENRRRTALATTVRSLSEEPVALERDAQGLQNAYPGLQQWIESMEAKSKRAEALYTQVYIGLRRWVSNQEASSEVAC